jgi:hypothetical protein
MASAKEIIDWTDGLPRFQDAIAEPVCTTTLIAAFVRIENLASLWESPIRRDLSVAVVGAWFLSVAMSGAVNTRTNNWWSVCMTVQCNKGAGAPLLPGSAENQRA